MFAGCCCAGSKEQGQITLPPSIPDEHVACDGAVGLQSTASMRNTAPAQSALPDRSAADTPAKAPISARSLTDEERNEKIRIQAMINRFAKAALAGCPCMCIREDTGTRFSTKYRINKSLEYLVVLSEEDAAKAEVTCPIADIHDIYTFVEDGAEAFPAQVMEGVSSEERPLLLRVVFGSDAKALSYFCLLEESCESRDTFLESLRVLCIYAASARGKLPP
mmetsp:Transcript_107362/g.346475  ORF Transcript_107362/g.346475 Transcript_107362/m.346475 type:complete len:221 (-) Transcript_107362:318-980(-)